MPVFATDDYGPEQIALRYKSYTRAGTSGFVQAYRDILTNAGPAFGKILRHLSKPDTEPTACVFHCTAGKDRTGLLAALLLSHKLSKTVNMLSASWRKPKGIMKLLKT